ncbi:MAG TPA: hypothetical protein VHO24_05895 [Opitutaceae bacterium]|nr:hypothetical protein [Opitutaceae bacterium]
MPRNPDDPSLLGWLAFRFVHTPRSQLQRRNWDFLIYLLLRRVRGGPFTGLRYVGDSPNPQIAPFLLGLNEMEIWPFVERVQRGGHDVFIDIGAAEGYYVAGMARFSPIPKIISYEGDRFGRILTRYMCRKNNVAGRVDVRGLCSPAELETALAPYSRPALLMDVEGYEEVLADPAQVPALVRTTMIIELHEDQKPLGDILRPRFARTHQVEEVWTRPRTPADLPASLWPASLFFSRERLLAIGTEHRGGPMRWWLLTPKPVSA